MEMKVHYVSGRQNILVDMLSRWGNEYVLTPLSTAGVGQLSLVDAMIRKEDSGYDAGFAVARLSLH